MTTEYRLLRYDLKPGLTAGLFFRVSNTFTVKEVDGNSQSSSRGLDFLAHTLEDTFRPGHPKIPGQTCIPLGVYKLKLTNMPTLSAKYGHDMIEVSSVPGFSGVAIHVGNTVKDTLGCVLIGRHDTGESIGDSRSIYNELYPKIAAEIKAGEVWLRVVRV